MKKIIFLITASLLILACSNDDNEPQPEGNNQALKTFRFLENNGPTTLDSGKEFFLDQDGKMTMLNVIIENQPISITSQYLYNNDGTRNKIERKFENSLVNTFYYEYNNLNQIKKITNDKEDDDNPSIYDFEYSQGAIAIKEQLDMWSTVYSYNGNKLVNVATVSDNGPILSFELIYIGDNVTQILEKSLSEVVGTYTIEYDTKTNPLYSNFKEDTFFYSDIYDIDNPFIMEWVYYLSANNFTSIHYDNGNPNMEYTESNEIEYNENGKPISSISTSSRENLVVRRLTYQYY